MVETYTLPIATATELGGIKVGSGLDNQCNHWCIWMPMAGGTTYTLPAATTTTLGGVIVGSGLSVTADGTTSVDIATTWHHWYGVLLVMVCPLLVLEQQQIDQTSRFHNLVLPTTLPQPTRLSIHTVTWCCHRCRFLLVMPTRQTALQTTRSLWGQNFDGTADVTGALTDVHFSITGVDLTLNGTTTIQLKPDSDTGLELFNGRPYYSHNV